jgi:hypothetical protein
MIVRKYQKRKRGFEEKSSKVLIEKKKRASGSKLRLKSRFCTNSGPWRGGVIDSRELKWLLCWEFTRNGGDRAEEGAAAKLQW